MSKIFDDPAFDPFRDFVKDVVSDVKEMFRTDVKPINPYDLLADLWETETEYMIIIDLPGYEDKNIKLEFRENVLTLSGEREEEKLPEGAKLIHQNRKKGGISKRFVLFKEVDPQDIQATFKKGILTITLKKIKPKEAQKINIKVED